MPIGHIKSNINDQQKEVLRGRSRIYRCVERRPRWGRQLLTLVLFGKNVCEMQELDTIGGAHTAGAPWIRHWFSYL